VQDLTRQIRSCIDQRREEQLEITVSSVADLFIELHPDQVEQWKDELLHNAIANKVRAMLRRLESDASEQMVLNGIEFPSYICTVNDDGNKVWLHLHDAKKRHYGAWCEISARNKEAVDAAHAKRIETRDFMYSLFGDNEEMTTYEALDRTHPPTTPKREHVMSDALIPALV